MEKIYEQDFKLNDNSPYLTDLVHSDFFCFLSLGVDIFIKPVGSYRRRVFNVDYDVKKTTAINSHLVKKSIKAYFCHEIHHIIDRNLILNKKLS